MIFFLKKNKREKYCSYRKLLPIAVIGFIALFLGGSLVSFNMYDPSFFYKTTSTKLLYTNWFGAMGSYCASGIIFLFGGIASFMVVGFLFFLLFLMLREKNYKQETDRIISYLIMLLVIATDAHFYGIDFFSKTLPGGVIGNFVHALLTKIFDPFLLGGFLIISSLCCLIIFSRLSGFVLLAHMFCKLSIQESTVHSIVSAFHRVYTIIASPLRKSMNVLFALCFGSKTKQDSYVFYEFEQEVLQLKDDDAFWETFTLNETTDVETIPNSDDQKNNDFSDHHHDAEIAPGESAYEPTMVHESPASQKLYQIPSISLFKPVGDTQHTDRENHKVLAAILEEKLERFGIRGHVTDIKVGPVITLFEYEPEIDSKISKIIALEDDLALALQALSIRIIAPIPGRSVVGFEVSNKQRCNVLLGEVLQSPDFKNFVGHLPIVLGQDSIGATVIVDLVTMPHLLIAGSTGSGKSVALNSMLVSLLCKHPPETLKLILIDPKRLEFASYADIPHLVVPIVTDPRKASLVLKWVVKTMEERYALMESCNVRNIFDYHMLVRNDKQKKEEMPFILIMIDELSDLMMTAPKETEDLIARITQMARAAGIHMIVATQRPSVDVITGLIKVNFPSRISFRVTSKIDSRTILDCSGADKLLGKGDMLFLDSSSRLKRAHAAYVSDQEIEKLVHYIRSQQTVQYIDLTGDFAPQGHDDDSEIDEQLYSEVLRFIESVDKVSISLLQRKFRIGYNRSARIIDKLESHGIIMQDPDGRTRKVIR